MMRKMLVVFVVAAMALPAMGSYIDGNTNYTRHDATAWVGGDILVDGLQVSFWTRPYDKPVPGKIGEWGFSAHADGTFFENASAGDIAFALANPRQGNGGRQINTLRYQSDPWGSYVVFDPKLKANWTMSANIYDFSSGGGKGVAANAVSLDDLWGSLSLQLMVSGGSITSSGFYLDTLDSRVGAPDWAKDWSVDAYFSGVIESESFSVFRVVPEPSALALLGLGGVLLRRRQGR